MNIDSVQQYIGAVTEYMFNYFDLTMLLIFPTILISIALLIIFVRLREKKYQQSTYREAIQLLILLRHLVASLKKHRGLSTGFLRGG